MMLEEDAVVVVVLAFVAGKFVDVVMKGIDAFVVFCRCLWQTKPKRNSVHIHFTNLGRLLNFCLKLGRSN